MYSYSKTKERQEPESTLQDLLLSKHSQCFTVANVDAATTAALHGSLLRHDLEDGAGVLALWQCSEVRQDTKGGRELAIFNTMHNTRTNEESVNR